MAAVVAKLTQPQAPLPSPMADRSVLPRDRCPGELFPRPPPVPTTQTHFTPTDALSSAGAQPSGQRPVHPSPSPSAPVPSSASLLPAPADCDPDDRETILKSASRPRFTESSGMKMRAFLEDAELFLSLRGCPRTSWSYFVLSWLSANESEKGRRSHLVERLPITTRSRQA